MLSSGTNHGAGRSRTEQDGAGNRAGESFGIKRASGQVYIRVFLPNFRRNNMAVGVAHGPVNQKYTSTLATWTWAPPRVELTYTSKTFSLTLTHAQPTPWPQRTRTLGGGANKTSLWRLGDFCARARLQKKDGEKLATTTHRGCAAATRDGKAFDPSPRERERVGRAIRSRRGMRGR
jgi:hypothetical protein